MSTALSPTPLASSQDSVPPHGTGPTEDLYPKDEKAHAELVHWCESARQAAFSARQPFEQRWIRYHRLYNAYLKRDKRDWRSKVFIPIAFWVIETILPRLVTQLPRFIAQPVSEDDRQPAMTMEELLQWAATNADLFVELVLGTRSALKYGTGILKTSWRHTTATARKTVPNIVQVPFPVTRPVPDPENPMGVLIGPDGQPVTETVEQALSVPVGTRQETYRYVAYDGPAASWVDPFHFWVAPEAVDVQTARYVIHRSYRSWSYVARRVAEGVYRLPPNMGENDIMSTTDDPVHQRLNAIGAGGGEQDATRKDVELLELWTDDGRVITVANRKAILRCAANPFDHGQKPFVRLVDHLQEGQFWGVGEIQMIEGQQDLLNVLTNGQVDTLRLTLEAMFAVKPDSIVDQRDLRIRPGGVIRMDTDSNPQDVLHRLDFGSVDPASFEAIREQMDVAERVSGANAYTAGQDSPSLNDTATGVHLLQEAGVTRFTLKARLNELMGLKDIGRHWASMCQQFMTAPFVLRLLGPQGAITFQTFTCESIQGQLDVDIETASSTATDSQRRAESMTLLQVLGRMFPPAVPALVEDLLQSFGKKDLARYLQPQAEMGAGPLGLPGSSGNPGSPGSSGNPGMPPGGLQPGQGPPQPGGQVLPGAQFNGGALPKVPTMQPLLPAAVPPPGLVPALGSLR